MNRDKSLDEAYFKSVYDANEDPWNFEKSEYEAAKYAATLAALPKPEYENALEIGCSIGVLTKELAKRCNQLQATDVSEKALAKAKERCKEISNISFRKMSFPNEIPMEIFDLIVISEVAYYLSAEDWKKAIDSLGSIMSEDAQVILVHWLPLVPDYPLTGDEVHELFKIAVTNNMNNLHSSRAEHYRIDVWEKC